MASLEFSKATLSKKSIPTYRVSGRDRACLNSPSMASKMNPVAQNTISLPFSLTQTLIICDIIIFTCYCAKEEMPLSTKENKQLVRDGISEWNALKGDLSRVRPLYAKYYASDFIYHNFFRGDMNLEQTIQFIGMLVSAFPDLYFSIDDMVAEGDKVVMTYTMKATQKGTFMGVPATGKQFTIKGIEIEKITGKKVIESWDSPNTLGMMTQLGIAPGSPPKT